MNFHSLTHTQTHTHARLQSPFSLTLVSSDEPRPDPEMDPRTLYQEVTGTDPCTTLPPIPSNIYIIVHAGVLLPAASVTDDVTLHCIISTS